MFSEKTTKFYEISTLLLSYVMQIKSKWRFHKILWPSQNVLTLKSSIMTFFSFQWPVWLQSTKRYWMVRLMHTTCISAPAGNISIMRTAFFFFLGFLMYWKKLWNSICDMDSNISTLLIGFSLLHTKTKTNQTHNVKDLMVVEFFSNNVYKVQLTFYSLYWRNMVYYYKIS